MTATSLNTGVGSNPVGNFVMGAITTTLVVVAAGTSGIGAAILEGVSAMIWGIVARENNNRN